MIIEIIQATLAVLLVVAILMQNRGAGLGSAFGGGGNVYHTRRSLEKVLFYATIVIAVLFFITAMVNIIL